MKWQIDDLVKATQGRLICKHSNHFDRVCTDTRQSDRVRSSAFFALKGKRDGHGFIQQAFQKGAVVFVVENVSVVEHLKNQATIIHVPDTLEALGKWALFWRRKLRFKVAAITGSNGKTTAKHFCQILLKDNPSVRVSPKNYNNQLGVPLSLLDTNSQTKILIQEIGTSRPGEIQYLCSITRPDIVACTLVSDAHLEGLGNLQQVAQEKEKIYLACPQAVAVFNLDNPWTAEMKNRFYGEMITFSSKDSTADIFLKIQQKERDFLIIEGSIKGERGSCRVFLAGTHHLTSLMTSVGVVLALGQKPQSIWERLPFLKNPEGRCQFLTLDNKTKVFFDAYNSNPQSMTAFLDHVSFLNLKTPCVLCQGDMLELGDKASFFHRELGKKVASIPLRALFFIGQYRFDFEKGLKEGNFQGTYQLFEKYERECSQKILSVLESPSFLALKASRRLKFERIIEDLNFLMVNK